MDMWTSVIFPYLNFFLFLGLAVYFFRKPGREAARKKRADFERLMGEAKAARDEAEARLNALKRREAELDREIAEIKAVSTEASQAEARKIINDAEQLAAHLRHEAQRIAAAEVEKARSSLRSEIVDAVREGVTQRIKTELNPDAQLKIVRNRIGELKNIRAEG